MHYFQRQETHGIDQVLAEYRAFVANHIEVVTTQIQLKPIILLPLRHRSRTGRPKLTAA